MNTEIPEIDLIVEVMNVVNKKRFYITRATEGKKEFRPLHEDSVKYGWISYDSIDDIRNYLEDNDDIWTSMECKWTEKMKNENKEKTEKFLNSLKESNQ